MIDLHAHIVPGVDDGARSLSDSLEMARMAAKSGVTILAATSHGEFSRKDPGEYLRLYRERLLLLRRKAREEGIPLKIVSGMEILLEERTVACAGEYRLPSLHAGRWSLVEFPFDITGRQARMLLDAMLRKGYHLILAHPERYDFVKKDPGCVREIVGDRVLLQINKGSLLRELGERSFQTADWLVSRGLADLIASDAHDPVLRTPDLGGIRDAVELRYGRQTAAKLLWRTPAKILKDADLFGFHPSTTTRIF